MQSRRCARRPVMGSKKLKSSSLITFNRKVTAMVERRLYDPEPSEDTDTLPALPLGQPLDSDSSTVPDFE